jgi:hypothetical protein
LQTRKIFLLLLIIIILQSCSINTFIIRQTGAILDYGVIALYEETDLKLAEQALASDIKLLEGMIKGDPENEHLLILTSQALSGYTLGFVEDEEPERAKVLYLRAKEYGMRVLRMEDNFSGGEAGTIEAFTQAVSALDEDYLEALFWTGFAWGGWINLSLDNPRALIELTKVQVLMQRVQDLDETFFFGGAGLFFGSVWGLKPRMLGGDPEKAKEYFERNLEITGKNFLLTYIYYARFYAAKTLNEELFDQLLAIVDETPAGVLPDYQLLNMIAKKKAGFLKKHKEEWF